MKHKTSSLDVGELPSPQFDLGRLLATPGALHKLSSGEIQEAIARHQSADWGDVGPHDWAENEEALTGYRRLFSAYHSQDGVKFWVITEADRAATTVLLPNEY